MALPEKNYLLKKNSLVYRKSWFQLIRPLTFTATLSPVMAGSALAEKNGPFQFDLFIYVLLVGLLVQSSVNMLNDYYDFQKGQDQEKWVLSTKSKNVINPPYHSVPVVAGILLILAIIIGLGVGLESNRIWVLMIGGLGVICGYKYSAGVHSLSSLGLAEVIAFIFLGFFPTLVGYVVHGQFIDIPIVALALPYSLVVTTMLLTNNIRDIQKDKNIRSTVAMKLGRKRSAQTITMILALSYLFVFLLIYLEIIPPAAFSTLVAIPAALKLRWLLRPGASRANEINAMKWSAIHHWIFGMTLALSIWLYG